MAKACDESHAMGKIEKRYADIGFGAPSEPEAVIAMRFDIWHKLFCSIYVGDQDQVIVNPLGCSAVPTARKVEYHRRCLGRWHIAEDYSDYNS